MAGWLTDAVIQVRLLVLAPKGLSKMRDFRAFKPATIDTFAEVWYHKCYHYLRQAIGHLRDKDFIRAYRDIGTAGAAVSVLYDVCDYRAFQALQSFRRVNWIVGTRGNYLI